MNVSETDMPLFYQNKNTVSKEFRSLKFIANQICVQRRKEKEVAQKIFIVKRKFPLNCYPTGVINFR